MSGSSLTPMMKQFFDIKNQYPDFIIFFRLGDFYELFDQDAIDISPVLGLTLTKRQEFAMCGFPHHAKNNYLQKLMQKNYKVAICEQVENQEEGKKTFFDRQVTEMITPGTYLDTEKVDSRYLLSFSVSNNTLNYTLIEPSTGDIFVSCDAFDKNSLLDLLEKYKPSEILYSANEKDLIETLPQEFFYTQLEDHFYILQKNESFLKNHFKVESLTFLDLQKDPLINVLGSALRYIYQNLKKSIDHITRFHYVKAGEYLYLSESTIRHLEIIEPLFKSEIPSSLYQQLNCTKTSLGTRYLKHIMLNPSYHIPTIKERQDIVEQLVKKTSFLKDLRSSLALIPDIERLFSKVVLKKATPKDLWNLYTGLYSADQTLELLKPHKILDNASFVPHDSIQPILDLIKTNIEENPPLQFGQEPVIKDSACEELKELRKKAFDSYSLLLEIETQEQQNSGLNKLKLKYNKILGYYFEIPKGSVSKVPSHFIKKQSLVNVERFTIEALIAFESQVLDSKSQLNEKETELFNKICETVSSYTNALESYCRFIKNIDILSAFAHKAIQNNYTKPEIIPQGTLSIKEGRHPVVEQFVDDFIANSLELPSVEKRLAIVSGPNMGGKSTFLRQTAIITLMAHMGSFVPASYAQIPLTDKIYTRIGASDNLAKGESTFLVEMSETAQILRGATSQSLIIMDEIGRGTSTNDGLSLAWAILKYLCDPQIIRGKVLFATHYHELAQIADSYEQTQNLRVAISEYQNKIVFLHKVENGIAQKSYGITVAELAGLPKEVITQATDFLELLSQKNSVTDLPTQPKKAPLKKKKEAFEDHPLVVKIKSLDLNQTTPLEALKILEELKTIVKNKDDSYTEYLF